MTTSSRFAAVLVLVLTGLAHAQTPSPTLPPEPGAWVSTLELGELPTSGDAWERMRADAAGPLAVNLGDQDDRADSSLLAAALVARRLELAGDPEAATFRARAEHALEAGTSTLESSTALGPARNVCAFVLAADVLDYRPESFQAWARAALTLEHGDGRSIVSTHEDRPNNWGTHAGASRAAIAAYLGDARELARCAQVFRGWLGDRSSYAGFQWGELTWQADPAKPVGVNPAGARWRGVPLGGVLPDDQRRCGSLPDDLGCQTNYAWEALQGALVQAVILRRAGYDAWRWGQLAIGRAAWWLAHWNEQPPDASINGTDDRWQAYVLRRVYPTLGRELRLVSPAPPGKHVGYTDWLTSGTSWP